MKVSRHQPAALIICHLHQQNHHHLHLRNLHVWKTPKDVQNDVYYIAHGIAERVSGAL